MTIPTVSELLENHDKTWSETANFSLDFLHVTSWHLASELASMLETYMDVEEMMAAAQVAVGTLMLMQEYFEKIKEPMPCSMALVLLRVQRHREGLPD